jgi:hypothetical protein
MPCKPPMFEYSDCKFDPALLIQDITTSAPIYKKGEALKKLAALRLFVETMPIYIITRVEEFKPLDRVVLDPEASLHPLDDQVRGG